MNSKTFRKLFILCLVTITSCISPPNEFQTPSTTSSSNTSETFLRKLLIVVLDIGQGDATLFVTPSGKTILIDAGPPDGYAAILDTLEALHIQQIDYAIASHYDSDHIGGFPFVASGQDQIANTDDDIEFTIVLDHGSSPLEEKMAYTAYVGQFSAVRKELKAGETIDTEDGFTLECLMANHELGDGTILPLLNDDENSHSLALLIHFGNFAYLTAGDLPGGGLDSPDLESTLGQLAGRVDVLHVGHHGSASATNQNLLDEIHPTIALISTGDGNRYGHPAPDVLFRLHRAGVEVYQTETGNGGLLPGAHIRHGNINLVVDKDGTYEVAGDEYHTSN